MSMDAIVPATPLAQDKPSVPLSPIEAFPDIVPHQVLDLDDTSTVRTKLRLYALLLALYVYSLPFSLALLYLADTSPSFPSVWQP